VWPKTQVRLVGERGYMSLPIDVVEIRALVRGPDHGGFAARGERSERMVKIARPSFTPGKAHNNRLCSVLPSAVNLAST